MLNNILPNFVCRVSGIPTETIQALSLKNTNRLAADYILLLKQIDSLKDKISQSLFEEISNESDKQKRNFLLQVRRDIFKLNLNKVQNNNDKLIINNSELLNFIEHLNELIKQAEGTKLLLKNSFKYELIEIRNQFMNLIVNDDFQKGLMISSSSLYSSLELYLNSNPLKLNRKFEQAERGLLRYYTRMSMKATPFGTFCNIIPGRIEQSDNNKRDDKKFFDINSDLENKQSLILLNKELFGILKKSILKCDEIRKEILIELNPTITSSNEVLRFLTEVEGKEVFQRVSVNPVLEYIFQSLNKLGAVKYSRLTDTFLESETIDADKSEIENYLDKLLEIGFLQYRFNIPDQEINWNKLLIDLLESIESEKSRAIIKFLNDIQNILTDYSTSTVSNRYKLLSELDTIVKSFFTDFEIEESLRGDLLFYEDATSNSFAKIHSTDLENIEIILNRYIELTSKIAYPRIEQISMRHFFDDFYKDKKEVGLLEFYEDYYREHFKAHIEKQQKIQAGQKDEELKDYNVQNPFKIEVVDKITAAYKKVAEVLIDKWNDNQQADEIKIELKEIEEIVKEVPELYNSPKSASVFAQIIPGKTNNNEVRLIVPEGKYLLGYGKYFSRFLRLLTEAEQRNLFEVNLALTDKIVAEISGDANFNANLHPSLTKYEIFYPTTEGGLAEESIKCTDISVVPDEGTNYSLKLVQNECGKTIIPLDLGFLNPMMRPPLFQMLSKFTPPSNYSVRIPQFPVKEKTVKHNTNYKAAANGKEIENEKQQDEPKIIYRPRILLENFIVLSRKCWRVPTQLFPTRDNNESDFEYFLKVQEWREEHGIPEEVYVRIEILPTKPTPQTKDAGEEKDKYESNKENEQKDEPAENNENEKADDENAAIEKNETEAKKTDDKTKKQKKFSRDFGKPQYISFNNPLLVNLFGKMTVNLKNFTVTLEERYPLNEDLPTFKGKHYTVEQIFQLNIAEEKNDLPNTLKENKHGEFNEIKKSMDK